MKTSVVIVTYNSRDLIDRCLSPLIPYIGTDLEVVIWDNASPDKTYDYLKKYPQVKILGGEQNLGFAAGNNEAFKYCQGEYLLLLNPDAFLDSLEQIKALSGILDTHVDVAAIGPRLINADGSHQVGDCGWELNLKHAIGHFLFIHRIIANFKSLYLTNASLLNQSLVDVDWVCGACMLVRKSVVDRIGGMDGSIFMYGEDTEWGTRMRRSGYRVLYSPKIKVLHLQGSSQKAGQKDLFFSTKWLDAAEIHMSKESSRSKFLLFKATLLLGFYLRGIIGRTKSYITENGNDRSRAKNMFCYAKHVASFRYKA